MEESLPIDQTTPSSPPQNSNKKKLILIGGSILILLLLAFFAATFFISSNKIVESPQTNQPKQEAESPTLPSLTEMEEVLKSSSKSPTATASSLPEFNTILKAEVKSAFPNKQSEIAQQLDAGLKNLTPDKPDAQESYQSYLKAYQLMMEDYSSTKTEEKKIALLALHDFMKSYQQYKGKDFPDP